VPLLCLNALDDPVCVQSAIPVSECGCGGLPQVHAGLVRMHTHTHTLMCMSVGTRACVCVCVCVCVSVAWGQNESVGDAGDDRLWRPSWLVHGCAVGRARRRRTHGAPCPAALVDHRGRRVGACPGGAGTGRPTHTARARRLQGLDWRCADADRVACTGAPNPPTCAAPRGIRCRNHGFRHRRPRQRHTRAQYSRRGTHPDIAPRCDAPVVGRGRASHC
jgi:hypothetical protein